MKIAVIGGAGQQGLYAVRELIRKGIYDEIIIASRNIDNVNNVVKELDSPKVSSAQVDVMDRDSLMSLLEKVDVVANASGPYYLLAEYVVDACIDSGVHYVDLCDDIVVFEELYTEENHQRAIDNDVTILMGLGASPGINPLHAYYHAKKLDEVHDISFNIGGSKLGILTGEAVLVHMLQNMLGEIKTIRDGKIYMEEPFEGLEYFDFDDLGELPISTLGHPEIFTLPRVLPNIQNLKVKIGYVETDWYMNFVDLLKSGFGSEDPIMVKENKVKPMDFLVSKLLHDVQKVDMSQAYGKSNTIISVSGIKDEKEVEYRSTYVTGSSATIGYPLAMAADLLGNGTINKRGMVVAEECIDPKPFIDDFAERMHDTGYFLEIREEYIEKGHYIKPNE